jgi:hypothetical protein
MTNQFSLAIHPGIVPKFSFLIGKPVYAKTGSRAKVKT